MIPILHRYNKPLYYLALTLFNIGSGSISWSTKRQPTVSLSSYKAEYQGQTQATKEAMLLRWLLNELVDQGEPNAIMYRDNQGALALAKNPTQHGRTKHIDIQHYFVRESMPPAKWISVMCLQQNNWPMGSLRHCQRRLSNVSRLGSDWKNDDQHN